MIRLSFLIIAFSICNTSLAQFNTVIQWESNKPSANNDTIYYDSNRKLTWADFRGKPAISGPAAAITESGFGFKMSVNSFNRKTDMVITVFCYFNKEKSWVRPGMDDDYALEHEQHHFDITYINAVLFIQKLRKAQFNRGNFNVLVNKIHDECFTAMDKMQDEYDSQTSNGRIKSMQKAWNKKVSQQLDSLTTN